MVIVPKVTASDHWRDDPVAPLLRELSEDCAAEARGGIEPAAALARDPLDEVRADELTERAAHVRQVQARLFRDLHGRLRPRDDGGEDRFALSTREDEREPFEEIPGSRLPALHRKAPPFEGCKRWLITLSSGSGEDVRQEDGDQEGGHQMDAAHAKGHRPEPDQARDGRNGDTWPTGHDEQEALDHRDGNDGNFPRIPGRPAARDPLSQPGRHRGRQRSRERSGHDERDQGGLDAEAGPGRRISREFLDSGRDAAARPMNHEEHRGAQEARRRGHRPEDDHELPRPGAVAPSDRCQGRGRAAAEAREPGDRRTRGRPSQRAADIAPRKATQRIDTLRRDPTRVASEADEERRKSEEAGEEREQHDVRIERDRPAKGQGAEEAREALNPRRSEAPPNPVPSPALGGEDRAEQAQEEQRAPRTESGGQLDRIAQHKSERDQEEDREQGPERRSAGRERDRPRALSRPEETMARQGREGRG